MTDEEMKFTAADPEEALKSHELGDEMMALALRADTAQIALTAAAAVLGALIGMVSGDEEELQRMVAEAGKNITLNARVNLSLHTDAEVDLPEGPVDISVHFKDLTSGTSTKH